MNQTDISYLDFTCNPTHGCTPVSPGCWNCWARAMSKRLAGMGKRGYDPAEPFKVVCDESKLDEPLQRKKPAVIGLSFMGDLFHDDVPLEFIDRVFATMVLAWQHTFLLLTKRPWRADEYLRDRSGQWGNPRCWGATVELLDSRNTPGREWQKGWPLPNVCLGTSASTQDELDRNLAKLSQCRAARRWLSIEPILEAIDLEDRLDGIDAVVVGCESGPGRRPCKLGWISSIVAHCNLCGVHCHVKQIEINGRVVHDPNHPKWPRWAKQPQVFRHGLEV